MNPEVSPWTMIANKQRYIDIKRERDEQQLKNYIRTQYQKQLTNQMAQQREQRVKQKQKEKQWEKSLLNSSIQNQQRVIQLQKLKAMASSEKQSRMDFENQYYQAARKQRQGFLQDQGKKLEQELHKQAEERQKKQMVENERKKKMVLDNLKGSIEEKMMKDKLIRKLQNQFEDYKLRQNEMLNQREQFYREDYLRKLKEKALRVDYGSHDAFQKNYQKTLVQRKKEQWESEQQYLRRAQKVNVFEDEYKKLKKGMENEYRTQLKKQMVEDQENKYYIHRKEVENDFHTIQRSQNHSKSVEFQKKMQQDRNKKQYLQFLQRQVDQRRSIPKQPYLFLERQAKIHSDILRNTKGIIPGQTYDLDHGRKKQLQTVARSIANSPSHFSEPYNPLVDRKYLAERGKTILY